jgi:hypothetical protein
MTVIKLKSGNYSDIKLISLLKSDIYVEKIYGKKTIIGTKITTTLFEYFLKYKKIAISIGLPICDTSYDRIIHGSKNSYFVEFQSYIPTNFEDFVRSIQDSRTLTLYVEKYLLFFYKILKAKFPIGADPSLRNFGINGDGDLIFFDFFPPHQKLANGGCFFWPAPSVIDKSFFIDRYFSTMQIRVIYAQLLRHLIIHKFISPQKLKDLIGTILGVDIVRMLTISEVVKNRILSKPNPHDMDIIRMIACELCFEKKITHNQLSMVFKNTHISNQNILPSQPTLEVITKILKKAQRL